MEKENKKLSLFGKIKNYFYKKTHRVKPSIKKDKFNIKTFFSRENFNRYTIKAFLLGSNDHRGFLITVLIYVLLILFGFVYVYPMLYMLGYSMMSSSDLVNPMVNYLPTSWYFENFNEAVTVLDYWKNLGNTLLISIVPALCQTVACALAGYGLARYSFKGKKVIFGLIVFTFLIPSCLTMFPQLSLFVKLGLVNNILAYIVPALLGQGFKSAVFILIFYQYFKAIPNSLVEAAKIDGANDFIIFIKLGIPAAKSAIILSILLSTVWYYNETVLAALFIGDSISTLPLQLENFEAAYSAIFGGSVDGKSANEAVYMAGTLLNILPLLLIYFLSQKYFVQGLDKAGITGE